MLIKSQRSYVNKITGERFDMFTDSNKHTNILINPSTGESITSFFCCAFDAIEYKFKNGEIIGLNMGEFLPNLNNQSPTHKKFNGFDKFVKI